MTRTNVTDPPLIEESPMLSFARAGCAALAALLLATTASAQETTGNIEGYVLGEDGKPVQFANVVVSSPDLQGSRGVMTTSEGYFGVFKLPAGLYTVAISHVSYSPLKIEKVVVALGKTTTLPKLTMSTQVHEAETIIVTARRPVVDETTTENGVNLQPEEFGDLPLARDYREMATLLPMSNGSFFGDDANFAGATGLENRYYIDGIDVTDPFRGITGTVLPYNFIREVEVKTGAYQAEYRSSLGGVLNVVTRSGSNETHGQAFGFFTNNDFAGDRTYGAAQPETGDLALYDVGIAVSGPIKKDKLWYSLAYNPTVQDADVQVPGAGFHEDRTEKHIFASKLSWRASEKTDVALTIFGDPTTRSSVGETFFALSFGAPLGFENADPVLGDLQTGGVNGSLSATYFASDNLLFDADFSVVYRKYNLKAATEVGATELNFVDAANGVISGGFPVRTWNTSTQGTLDFNATWILGSHTLKGGLGYRDNGLDTYMNWEQLLEYSDTTYQYQTANVVFDGNVHNRIPSVYLQDSWKATDRLRINAGLRWESEFLTNDDGDVAQKILNEWQPRLGFTYVLGSSRSKKLFGNYGRFYHNFSMYLSTFWLTGNTVYNLTLYPQDPRVDDSGALPLEFPITQDEVDGLQGQHNDEFTLGYEQQVAAHAKIGLVGIYRTLGNGVEDGEAGYGNPGSFPLEDYPRMRREYTAFVVNFERSGAERFNGLVSYTLSSNKGNYPGLFNSDLELFFPNANASFDYLDGMTNADGYLPNDHRHVFKAAGSYRFNLGLTAGATFFWQSGAPRSEQEGSSHGPPFFNFVTTRGSEGRMPSVWDLNLRFVYDLSKPLHTKVRPRLIVDVFHVASQTTAVTFDQVRTFGPGADTNPNPAFGLATRYQPPTAMRLGFELDF